MQSPRAAAILTLCLAFGLAAIAFAEAPAAGGPPPKAVLSETVVDLGTVPKGDKASHVFVIKNEGGSDLEITDVRPTCGCTVAQYDKRIPPGGTGKVAAVIDTTTLNGPSSKSVLVYTNDPANAEIELTLKLLAQPYLAVRPGYGRWSIVEGEKEGTISQTIWAPDGTDFDVTGVDTPYPYLRATFRPANPDEIQSTGEIKPGKQWKVDLTLDSNAPVGALAENVIVHTNHPKQKVVNIPISGFVRPVLAVTPPEANVGRMELTEPTKKALLVRSFSTEPIKVTAVEDNVPWIKAEISALEEGRRYQVLLTFDPKAPKGDFNGILKIHTDSPKKPLIEVELKGTIL